MPDVVQVAGSLISQASTSTVVGFDFNVAAGNRIIMALCEPAQVAVSSVTDSAGNTYSSRFETNLPSTGDIGRVAVFDAPSGTAGGLTVTVTMASIPAGGGQIYLFEVSGIGTPTTGPSNSRDESSAQNPLPCATLTTTDAGILICLVRVDSNFSATSFTDSFTRIGLNSGRAVCGYRTTTGGISASPSVNFTIAESGESFTCALYGAASKVGSFTFGTTTDVTATRAFAIGLDGAANVLSETGKFKVFGKGEFTDTVTLALGPAVAGVASAVDGEIALWDGTTGRKIKRATATGVAKVASGVLSASNVNLASEVTGDLPFANLVQASAASKLVGRGSAAGAGDFQEISLGSGLSLSGTTLSATGGGGSPGGDGDSTFTNTQTNRPSAANDGDLFFPSDDVVLQRDTGAAWASWGPIFPLTAPVNGDFAWVNQGSASVTASAVSVFLRAPTNSGVSWRIRKKSAPSTPYTITVALLPAVLASQAVAIVFRQSSDGKLIIFSLQNENTLGRIYVSKYTNETTLSANYTGSPRAHFFIGGVQFLRIADNGTDRIHSYSGDGQNFIDFFSVGRTDFLTADEVGFAVNNESSLIECGMTVISWKQA